MAVTLNLNLLFGPEETISEDALSTSVTHDGYNLSGVSLTSATTPPVTKCSFQDYALSGGTKTIDLTALLGLKNESQDCTGLKLQFLVFINAASNADMVISGEGANGYSLGAARTINGGTAANYDIMYAPESLPDVASGAKNLVVTGTGSQSFKLGVVLG